VEFELITHGPEETRELGRTIGNLAQAGDVILLTGDLGAGKTCLTQGIAFGLGAKDYALSPTFVIMRRLRGRLPLYHIDLYRLDRVAETEDLGLDDYFYGDGISVVEWAEKAEALMPFERLSIQIEYLSENERRFRLKSNGLRFDSLIESIKYETKSVV
jgi:tRNA threonylcarbamoyladenosine biosynthesis protein TsaE